MLVSRNREKQINAIVFFAANTKFCGKIKLFKLLYLLDFEHFRLTGRSATGLNYEAWKFGPVPTAVSKEWDAPDVDLRDAFTIVPERVFDHTRLTVVPLKHFDNSAFTQRQLALMNRLAAEYGDTYSPEMIDVTHAENGAWSKVWQGGKGDHQPIPYDLALSDDNPNADDIRYIAREVQAIERTATKQIKADRGDSRGNLAS